MKLVYRVGWPFWRLAFHLGMTLSYRYDIYRSKESGDYLGVSPDIKGLYAECKTIEEVIEVMESGAADFVREDLALDTAPALASRGILCGVSL